MHALGHVESKPHADCSAHGNSAEPDALKSEMIHHGEGVVGEQFDVVFAARGGGGAVAAIVVAHDAEARGERGDLRVPHGEVGSEGVGEDQHGGKILPSPRDAAKAVHAVMNPRSFHVNECLLCHFSWPSRYGFHSLVWPPTPYPFLK